MFCFERGYLLYALCLLPVFICFYIWKIKKQKAIIRRYGDEKLLGGLMPGLSYGMKNLKFILCCLIYACLIFTIANPQLGSGVEKGKRRGVDLMFCIDVSNSMLARDYAPNRLVSVKQGMMSLLDKLGGDRIGLVVFAGKSFVQLPITSDYAAAKMFMSNISTRSVSEQGTDLAGAIDKAAVSMLTEGSEDKTNRSGISKVMIIVSDGEDHAEDAVDMAKAAAERGISIYTLGIGSEEGEPIPIGNSQGVTTYKKDKDGNTVITRLNSDLLKEIAAAGKGKYIHASNAVVSFDKLYETINSMDKADIEDIVYTRYNTMFYVPLIIAIILLCIEFLLMNKKMLTLSKIPYLNKKIVCFLLLSIFVSLSVNAQTSKEMKYIRQGNREYEAAQRSEKAASKAASEKSELKHKESKEKLNDARKQYESAATYYLKSNESHNDYYKGSYNLGNALYKQDKYENAEKKYKQALQTPDLDSKTKSKIYHNLGNSCVAQKKYREGIDAYKKALKSSPKDMDTKYNLEYAKKKLAVQQQQQQQQQNNQDKNQQQNRQNQNKDQQQQQNGGRQDNRQNKVVKQNPQQSESEKEEKRQLEALQQNERHTQEKLKAAEQAQTRQNRQEKDW